MNTINNNLLLEIKKDAKEYISLIRGKDLTNTDLLIAENLMVLGFNAREEIMNGAIFKNRRLENENR